METIVKMMTQFYAGMYERDEHEDEGAALVEYGLLVGLIAVVSIAVLITLGGEIAGFFQSIVDALPG